MIHHTAPNDIVYVTRSPVFVFPEPAAACTSDPQNIDIKQDLAATNGEGTSDYHSQSKSQKITTNDKDKETGHLPNLEPPATDPIVTPEICSTDHEKSLPVYNQRTTRLQVNTVFVPETSKHPLHQLNSSTIIYEVLLYPFHGFPSLAEQDLGIVPDRECTAETELRKYLTKAAVITNIVPSSPAAALEPNLPLLFNPLPPIIRSFDAPFFRPDPGGELASIAPSETSFEIEIAKYISSDSMIVIEPVDQ